MKNILEYKRALAIAGAVSSAVSGLCWGYVIGHSEAEKTIEDRIDTVLRREVDRIHARYAVMYKGDTQPADFSEIEGEPVVDRSEKSITIPTDQLNTPEGRAAVMAALAREVDPQAFAKDEVAPGLPEDDPRGEVVATNLYDDPTLSGEINVQALIDARSQDAPYIISKAEMQANEAHYPIIELAFFEGDGILLTTDDDPIPDSDNLVGDENLQLFGVMSGDNKKLYIQNDIAEHIFDITHQSMSAEEHLYGVNSSDDAVLEHSSMKRRRPRGDG